jgi:hypothetical protein
MFALPSQTLHHHLSGGLFIRSKPTTNERTACITVLILFKTSTASSKYQPCHVPTPQPPSPSPRLNSAASFGSKPLHPRR